MVLPMVPIRLRDGNECQVGMAQLRQMALARAFPNATPEERLAGLTEVFDSPDILDQLCIASGGHVRNLLSLLFACLRKRKSLPITQDSLNLAIQQARDDLTATIDGDEWALLKQVTTQKKVNGEDECQALLRSLFVFEYRNDADGRWFDINPVLAGARELS